MDVEEDEEAGVTVKLDPGDDLAAVPASHRQLLTPEVRAAFANPPGHFQAVRDRSPVPNMRKWFDRVLKKRQVELWLEVGVPGEAERAGFFLAGGKVTPAIVGLPVPFDAALYPEPLAAFYRLVGFVSLIGLMFAGGIDRPPGGTLADVWSANPVVDAATTRIIGGSLSGDMMVCAAGGRCGWWDHETGRVKLTGTAAEFLDGVFADLLAGRHPECPR